ERPAQQEADQHAEEEDEGNGEDRLLARGRALDREADVVFLSFTRLICVLFCFAHAAMPPPRTSSPQYRTTLWPGATRLWGWAKRTMSPSKSASTAAPCALDCASTDPAAASPTHVRFVRRTLSVMSSSSRPTTTVPSVGSTESA